MIPDAGDGQLRPARSTIGTAARRGSTTRRASIGVGRLGAAQIDFLHAVYGNFPLMLA